MPSFVSLLGLHLYLCLSVGDLQSHLEELAKAEGRDMPVAASSSVAGTDATEATSSADVAIEKVSPGRNARKAFGARLAERTQSHPINLEDWKVFLDDPVSVDVQIFCCKKNYILDMN